LVVGVLLLIFYHFLIERSLCSIGVDKNFTSIVENNDPAPIPRADENALVLTVIIFVVVVDAGATELRCSTAGLALRWKPNVAQS
jgi:hypothetical protein